jgi:TolB-like protein/Tfp pilus assembly protein PilF
VRFLFEDCTLDPDRRELRRGSQVVSIGPQVFDLLIYLVRNRDRVVSKDELFDSVWSGRIVSESTLTSHINSVRKAVGDRGEDQRLIKTVSRRGFRFTGDVREEGAPNSSHAPQVNSAGPIEVSPTVLALPDRPSVAVLPFQNMSSDPEQDYFSDGIVEDIITALSRIRWLFVTARNSSFTYKGRSVSVEQVGRELGVRYVLEGSVRKVANRVRITGQLIDAIAGTHLWAERYEGTLDDIFTLQDQVATGVVGAMAPQLERAEIERALRKPTPSLNAYDFYLRGMAKLHRGTRSSMDEALTQFDKAIQLDPDFATAHAMAAWCHFWRKINGWSDDGSKEAVEGARLARRAVELDRDDAVTLARSGHVYGHLAGDLDSGVALLDRARILNPNLASAWFLGGFLRVWRGEPETAIDLFAHAMRLSPLDPELYRMQAGMAIAHLFAGHFDEASSWAEKAFWNLPSFLLVVSVVAASHALAGRTDAARQAMERLRQLNPALRVHNLRDWLPIERPEDLAVFTDGLRRAGLPD